MGLFLEHNVELIFFVILYLFLIYFILANNISFSVFPFLIVSTNNLENLIYVEPNRSYNRIKRKPSHKWCQYGNKYKMKH